MRFLMTIYPSAQAEAGVLPDAKLIGEMMKFNEEMAKAGVLISLDGLHPSSKGARVSFPGDKPKVTDGPFTESKEVLGGFWMINVKSKQEAIDWASRCPDRDAKFIEIRQVFEMSDFPEDVQKIAADHPAVRAEVEKHKRASS